MERDLPPSSPQQLDALEELIDAWLAAEWAENPMIDAVERDESGVRRWFVRVVGEEKSVWTLWLELRQRTLHFETYVLAAPEENEAAFYSMFLRRNLRLVGLAFAIGEEDAVFLVGALPHAEVTPTTLDRVLGSVYAAVEGSFRVALRLGFASRLKASMSD